MISLITIIVSAEDLNEPSNVAMLNVTFECLYYTTK